MPLPIYTIQFEDGSTYIGGDSILDSKWKDIPNKNISCLEYFFGTGESLVLRSFESYNHIVEATQNIYGPKGTSLVQKLENIYIMGCRDGEVTSYRISLKGESGSDKYHRGDITKRIIKLGKEFRGQPTINWKKGIIKKEVNK